MKRIARKKKKRELVNIILEYAGKNGFTATEIKKTAKKAVKHIGYNAILSEVPAKYKNRT